ncbi:MAG: flagellar motor stator protein MotA [Proteobacteria bacterium]|nr:flagellar motor stator protein MotA [Pseudomonadota bacterium]
MTVIIGIIVVIACVFGAYMAHGGHLTVLWQPAELIIIAGAATGAFIIANPPTLLSHVPKALAHAFKGGSLKKADYLELLTMLFSVFKLARSKGSLALESHIENPEQSNIFSHFPKFASEHHALTFFCDYMRMITMGSENPHQMADLMDEEIEIHHHEHHKLVSAIQTMADIANLL